MGLWIGLLLLVVALAWLFHPRRRSMPAPEDDVRTPLDQAELEQAERELKDDPQPRSLNEGIDDDADDWGPGTR